MMKVNRLLVFIMLFFTFSCEKYDNVLSKWHWLEADLYENREMRLIHEVQFDKNNNLRQHQSMCLYDNKAFCFNDGRDSYVFDINTNKEWQTADMPQKCHHNNAQFLDVYYEAEDKYPLLLLSRGDYPPSQNEFYIFRVVENNDSIYFHKVKTIKNIILEAKNNGSWLADTQNQMLYMYTMSNGDWQVTKDNHFCIYAFELPNLLDESDVTLKYEDVKSYWEYDYLIHQGGTFYNGYLFFNVQGLVSVGNNLLDSSFNVIAINSKTGEIDAVLPIDNSMETEGISIYNEKLYVSFKNGIPDQRPNDIVLRINEYTLPSSIVNNQ